MGQAYIGINVFGVEAQPPQPSRASVHMSENKHDMIVLTMNQADQGTMGIAVDQPISIRWGTLATARDIFGYVDTATPTARRGHRGGEYTLSVLGASSALRSSTPRIWKAVNPFIIAQQITDDRQFGLVMDIYPYTIDSFSQAADESDMNALKRLAQKIGYSLVPDGPVIQMIDPKQELARAQAGSCPTFTLPVGKDFVASTVDQFQADISSTPSIMN